jgi:hypothetical protein
VSGVWLWLPMVGPIRISTVIGAAVVFALIAIVKRDPLGGVVVVVAWTSVFETAYHVVGIVGYHWPLANFVWGTAAVAGWVILAAVLGYWPDWRLSVVFVLAMALWIAFGFHYNVPGQTAPLNVRDEILNEVAKSSLGLAYLVGALRAKNENLVKVVVQRQRGSAVGRHLHLHGIGARGDGHESAAR